MFPPPFHSSASLRLSRCNFFTMKANLHHICAKPGASSLESAALSRNITGM
ncbi:hypothetical protein ATN83_0938 [Raoultella ornithinolytica]|nr:hypothetical protein ATN83_0938 [Raoultella ornithinolytica]KDX12689.1 hypothetical protein AB28_3934 [Raoultella ornithinolytica 2-156-04_S1_C2]